jgi:hypothetical protein
MNAQEELMAHLGKRNYEAHKMAWSTERVAAVLAGFKDIKAFQQDKEALYFYAARESNDLWWVAHRTFIREVAGPCSLLEYHAATGWFGLPLADDYGYQVNHADYQSRCTTFLNWRLKRRKSEAEVWKLDEAIPAHDVVLCYDALQRYAPKDRWALVERLAGLGALVILDADVRQVENAAELIERIGRAYEVASHKVANHYVNLMAFFTEKYANPNTDIGIPANVGT